MTPTVRTPDPLAMRAVLGRPDVDVRRHRRSLPVRVVVQFSEVDGNGGRPVGKLVAGKGGSAVVRTGPLNWAQRIFWLSNYVASRQGGDGAPLIQWGVDVPPGATVGGLEEALGRCARAFEALRTVYVDAGARSAEQMVLRSHHPRIVDDREDGSGWLDISREPSVHCRVRQEDGALVRVTLVANQIDMDGWSMARVSRLLTDLLSGVPFEDAARGTSLVLHPLDAALQLEADDKHVRRALRGLAWVAEEQSRTPRNPLPVDRSAGAPGGQRGYSALEPGLMRDLRTVADVARVTAPTLVQAVIGILLARWTSTSRLFVAPAVSNRWRPESRTSIGRYATWAATVVEAQEDVPLAQCLRTAHRNLLQTYVCSPADFAEQPVVKSRADAGFGSLLAIPVGFEYLDFDDGDRADVRQGPAVTQPQRSRWTVPGPAGHVSFTIVPGGDDLRLVMTIDDAVAPPDLLDRLFEDVVDLLRRVSTLTAAELDQPLGTVCAPRPRVLGDAGTVVRRGQRFSGSRMRAAVMRDAVVDDVSFTVVRRPEERLVAVVRSGRPDLRAAHERLLMAAATDPLTVVADLYLRTTRADALPDVVDAVTELTGRPGVVELFDPQVHYLDDCIDTPERAALRRAFEASHPGRTADLTRAYYEQGGEHLRLPLVLERLRREGLDDVDCDLFLQFASLGAIAREIAADR
ncbi:hypothetical protein [Cellulomonas sp. S1-8]|uniref:hypothetical protein n=1 Tax=Cellulomonas sp. S1-8 TaxID=2904790 RepID=UPI002243146A|nr:hypothetical protein [Cellulomonas sp. S1-8]UZN03413.1 hypothetical protein OKX07_00255 [Cellulomonas sp. S1-8]